MFVSPLFTIYLLYWHVRSISNKVNSVWVTVEELKYFFLGFKDNEKIRMVLFGNISDSFLSWYFLWKNIFSSRTKTCNGKEKNDYFLEEEWLCEKSYVRNNVCVKNQEFYQNLIRAHIFSIFYQCVLMLNKCINMHPDNHEKSSFFLSPILILLPSPRRPLHFRKFLFRILYRGNDEVTALFNTSRFLLILAYWIYM